MSRITSRFQALSEKGGKALIPYITAGDPTPTNTVPIMHLLVESGADLIELGVPFSDPMADGPVIQRAYERALSYGVGLVDVLDMVREFRSTDTATPIILMGYLNPVETMGYREFGQAAAAAGVDGVLTVDLPPEEAHELLAELGAASIDPIFLLSPTSSPARIKRVAAVARGYIYYVSLKGVTGSSALHVDDVGDQIRAVKSMTEMPVGVGFGIKDAATAAALSRVADGVVVGSAIVSRIEELAADPRAMHSEVAALVSSMRRAIDGGAA